MITISFQAESMDGIKEQVLSFAARCKPLTETTAESKVEKLVEPEAPTVAPAKPIEKPTDTAIDASFTESKTPPKKRGRPPKKVEKVETKPEPKVQEKKEISKDDLFSQLKALQGATEKLAKSQGDDDSIVSEKGLNAVRDVLKDLGKAKLSELDASEYSKAYEIASDMTQKINAAV